MTKEQFYDIVENLRIEKEKEFEAMIEYLKQELKPK